MQILINFDDLIIFEKVCKYWSILSAIDAFEIQQYETSLLAIIVKNNVQISQWACLFLALLEV